MVNPMIYPDGDSRSDLAANEGRTTSQGWIWPLQLLTNARFDFDPADNLGVGGEDTSEILAGVTALSGKPPGIVIAIGSTNDRTAGWTAQQSTDNLVAYQNAVLSYGHKLIWVAETPRGDSNGPSYILSGDQIGYAHAVRQHLLDQASVPDVYVADPWPDMIDRAHSDGRARSGILRDGIHWGPTGALIVADKLAPIINALLPPRPRLIASPGDLYSAAHPRGALNPNPTMEGSGGTLGTGCTGQLATGWSAVAGAGLSALFRKTVGGYEDWQTAEWQEVYVSGAPTATTPGGNPIDPTLASVIISAPIDPSYLTAGDQFEAAGAVHILYPSGVRGVALYTSYTTADGTVTQAAGEPNLARSQPNLDLWPARRSIKGVAVVPKTAALPSGITAASVSIVISGAPHNPSLSDVPISVGVRFRAVAARKV